VIYKPLSVQSDWTDCNSYGTSRSTVLSSHCTVIQDQWLQGVCNRCHPGHPDDMCSI